MVATKKKAIKVLIKCSWSGARIPTPETFTSSSTLSLIISSISSKLPPLITNPLLDSNAPQPCIVYMRTNILKRDWEITRLADFCEGGSILLTLNLPKEDGIPSAEAAAAPESAEPMDIDHELAPAPAPIVSSPFQNTNLNANATSSSVTASSSSATSTRTSTSMTPKKAIQRVINSNFDKDSQECLTTILKIVDNILSKNDAKYRSIRITNKTIQKKLVSKKGGLDVLFALGFEYDSSTLAPRTTSFDFDNSSARLREADAAAGGKSESIILRPENEDDEILVAARNDLNLMLTTQLGVSQQDLPTMPRIQRFFSGGAAGSGAGAISSTPAPAFDPFKSQSFNTQAAAVGAPNPNSIVPDGSSGKSSTERELEMLQQKQERLEQSMQSLDDRCITAYLRGETGPIVSVRSPVDAEIGKGKGDGSLIAQRMMKQMEDRKKREEGGFTTKSMRDLEKMKKAKVYSHAQLKVCFPDGCWIEAKFLPTESISKVKNIVSSTFLPEHSTMYQFDLYISPPRHILDNTKSLRDEGLVPAAKIFVSWRKGASPLSDSPPGSFIQRQYYHNKGISTGIEAFPASIGLTETKAQAKAKANKQNVTIAGESESGKTSREDELIQRMLGKRKGLLGKSAKKSGSSNSDKKGPGKPKWLK